MTRWLVTLQSYVEVAADDADQAIEAAERLVMDGWAPPALRVVSIEPLRPSMELVLNEEAEGRHEQ